ncbi:MAG: hypothetical protein LC793_13120 [Thermomicrobia bacterium]|nr:hypothetical protein [Thermomicrobia bacterium]MCA1723331.1 hypothetical protein [Thermomicrobia bacterium]
MTRAKAPDQRRPADDARLATVVARMKGGEVRSSMQGSSKNETVPLPTPNTEHRTPNFPKPALPIAARLPVGFKRASPSSTRRERREEMYAPFAACLVPWNVPTAELSREERRRWKR